MGLEPPAESGFGLIGVERRRQRIARDLGAYADELRHRALPGPGWMDRAHSIAGFAVMDAAIAADPSSGPIEEDFDLLMGGAVLVRAPGTPWVGGSAGRCGWGSGGSGFQVGSFAL
ncbi:hypothetical protein [Streptodolium elevatio]